MLKIYHQDWKLREPKSDEVYLVKWDNEGMNYESLETKERLQLLRKLPHINVHGYMIVDPERFKLKATRKVCCDYCKKEITPYDDIRGTEEGHMHYDCEHEWVLENFSGYSLTYDEMIQEIEETEKLYR